MKKSLHIYLTCLSLGYGLMQAQYCPLTTGAPYSPNMPGILLFNLNTINRSSSHVESTTGTVVNTGLTTTLIAGQTYTIALTHSEDGQFFPGARNNLRVWIDYNKNFSFTDAGETVLSKDLEAPNTTYTATFIVPANTPTGTARLRATAKMSADAGHTLPTPCDIPVDPLGYHGEMEDYNVYIVTSIPPATAHCTFPGRAPYSPNTPGITNFRLNNINRTSAASESSLSIYVNTGVSTTLAIGKVYTVNISHSKDLFSYPNARNNIRIWADLNNNFAFDDPGETLLAVNNVSAGVYTGTLAIPNTATINTTRTLRVMVKQSADAGNTLPTSCDEPQDPQGLRGEVEDYQVTLVFNNTGIETAEFNSAAFQLIPNPVAGGEFAVIFDTRENANAGLMIYDLNGKCVKKIFLNQSLPPGSYQQNIMTNDLAKGIYLVELKTGDTSRHKKLVIQ